MRKKTILLAAIVLMLGITQTNAQVSFGVKAGLNAAKIVGKSENITTKSDVLNAPHFGITVELPISENLFVEPGLLFSAKGWKDNDSYENTDIFNLAYAELPINIMYKYPVGNGSTKILGFGGPYAGFLVSAKNKYDNTTEDIKKELNGLDYGINIGAGAEFNKLRLAIQYGFGLANIAKNTGDATLNNRVFGISLGYRFGGE